MDDRDFPKCYNKIVCINNRDNITIRGRLHGLCYRKEKYNNKEKKPDK